jgi:hypothetical protein
MMWVCPGPADFLLTVDVGLKVGQNEIVVVMEQAVD